MINFQNLKCQCPYNCGYVANDLITNRVNDLGAVTVTIPQIISGARCPRHNVDIKGAADSQHCKKCAIDGKYKKMNGQYQDVRKIACIAEYTGWFNGIARIDKYNSSLHTDTGNRPKVYLGDETKGFKFSTSNLQKYFGFSDSELVKILLVPNVNVTLNSGNRIYNMSVQLALKIQKDASGHSFYSGKIDGLFGNVSFSALKAYQRAIGFSNPDGVMEVNKTTARRLYS